MRLLVFYVALTLCLISLSTMASSSMDSPRMLLNKENKWKDKKWPTEKPWKKDNKKSQWKTKKKNKKKKKWPTPEPTKWPTPEPTEWPTPEPTEWPTPEPTEWPTPEPTDKKWKKDHKKKKKKNNWPTPKPTKKNKKKKNKKKKNNWPTPKPTNKPWKKNKKKWHKGKKKSKSSDNGCDKDLRDGHDLDYVLFIDGSCGLTDDQSDDYLEGIGEIIYALLGDDTRIITIQFGETDEDVKVLVDFKDDNKQDDAERYVKFIRDRGDATKGGDGDTDLYAALVEGEDRLDSDNDTKWIVVSACKHSDGDICKKAKKLNTIKKNKVDVYAVNVIKARKNKNRIKDDDDAEDYLSCLTDKDRVCLSNEKKDVFAFDEVIDDCLLPDICEPN